MRISCCKIVLSRMRVVSQIGIERAECGQRNFNTRGAREGSWMDEKHVRGTPCLKGAFTKLNLRLVHA